MDILLFLLGIALILFGANWLVDGSCGIARKYGLSEFIIGATIIGIGTSTPEMVVSVISSIKGNTDITIGNITGSNLFNTLMILGMSTLVFPVVFTRYNIRRDVPITIFVSVLLLLMSADILLGIGKTNTISRLDGIILLAFFIIFIVLSLKQDKKHNEPRIKTNDIIKDNADIQDDIKKQQRFAILISMIIFGLAALITGGELFIRSAENIALKLGISESVVAITIMAGGTSLPELASCIIAARKKSSQLALGNVIGSNISNILMILGVSAIINPLVINKTAFFSIIAVAVSSIILYITAFTFRKKELDRPEGIILILIYIAYICTIV